jgi:hypothetical protein
MWMDEVPESPKDLRQGDLLDMQLLPQLKIPFNIARPNDRDPRPDDLIVLKLGRLRHYLVVSQCCTIENDKVVAIAPIRTTHPLQPQDEIAYRNNTPKTKDDDPPYAYSAHLIESYMGEHPPPPGNNKLLIVDFSQIQTYSGDLSTLRAARIARMTVPSRRDLRLRLAGFWGRAEKDDSTWLDEHQQG